MVGNALGITELKSKEERNTLLRLLSKALGGNASKDASNEPGPSGTQHLRTRTTMNGRGPQQSTSTPGSSSTQKGTIKHYLPKQGNNRLHDQLERHRQSSRMSYRKNLPKTETAKAVKTIYDRVRKTLNTAYGGYGLNLIKHGDRGQPAMLNLLKQEIEEGTYQEKNFIWRMAERYNAAIRNNQDTFDLELIDEATDLLTAM